MFLIDLSHFTPEQIARIKYCVAWYVYKEKNHFLLWQTTPSYDQCILTADKKLAAFHSQEYLISEAHKMDIELMPGEPAKTDFDHAMDWAYERIPDYEMSYGETLDCWNALMDINLPLGHNKFTCWNLAAVAEKKYTLSKRERKCLRKARQLNSRIWRLAPMRKRHLYAFKQIFTTGLEIFEKNIQWCD